MPVSVRPPQIVGIGSNPRARPPALFIEELRVVGVLDLPGFDWSALRSVASARTFAGCRGLTASGGSGNCSTAETGFGSGPAPVVAAPIPGLVAGHDNRAATEGMPAG